MYSFPNFPSCYAYVLVVLALFILCLCDGNFDDALCMDDERQALLEFKQGVIDVGGRLASWVDQERDCCRWAGIVCDNVTGHVHGIHLPGFDGHCPIDDLFKYIPPLNIYEQAPMQFWLRGDLSPSLLHLKQLRHLDLSCNDFGGNQVPSFMGSLGNLRYLNLSNSGFIGIIPPQLGNLSKLHVLSLGSYHHGFGSYGSTLTMNMQWLSRLRLLRHLDISGMDLSKTIDWLQVINTLPYLVQLHLSNCQLPSTNPHVPALNMTSLSLLDLSYSSFISLSPQSPPWMFRSFIPPWIFSMTSLVSLDLSGCQFNGLVPASIDGFSNMTSLELLHVSGNEFISFPSVLKGLSSTVGSNLISLDISSCGVSSSVLDDLHNLTSLLSLDLSRNPINKTIPKSLGNICKLREINLSYMHFRNMTLTSLLDSFFECKSPRLELLTLWSSDVSGHIPDQLGQFIHLVHLRLGDNRITGTIPDSIGRLSFLRSLDLQRNQISGPIPYSIGRLSSLEVLALSNNQVNSSLPNGFGELSKLEYLDISNNLLTGVVTEAHFAKLASLKYLFGAGNNLSLRPRIENWIPPFRLQYLNLNSWVLGPQFPLWLHLQRDLRGLDISNTNISATMPRSFWRSFPNLMYLYMSENHIGGTLSYIPATLVELSLSLNEFTGQLPHLSNSSALSYLDLSDNFFVGSLHHFLCSNDEKSTQILNLGNNHLSGVIPECWEKWPNLSFLNIENNNLSGRIPTTLGSLSRLFALNMHGNKLSGRLPASLMNLASLTILQLGKNELVGSIPAWLGRKRYLRILSLRLNNFDGNIPYELCNLRLIQILDLSHNNISGNIPRCFNNFIVLSGKEDVASPPHMTYSTDVKDSLVSDSLMMKGREDIYSTIIALVRLLDFSSNNISGHIPYELTALKELKTLNLSRNQLTGRIPDKIGDMKSLETFDISLNMLSGELPMSLSSLSFLGSFNVSYNNLSGRIPTSTQLQSFNESSFFGNKLCGDPVTERCAVEVADKDKEIDDGSHGADWGLVISMAFGLATGFWIIMGPLIVSRSWRIAHFRFLSEVHCMVYDVIYKYCRCKVFCK